MLAFIGLATIRRAFSSIVTLAGILATARDDGTGTFTVYTNVRCAWVAVIALV